MILTITMNPAVDRVYQVPRLAVGEISRPTQTSVTAGGKGINVARVIHRLGGEVIAAAAMAGDTGKWIASAVKAEGIRLEAFEILGENRTCIAIMDSFNGLQTEINESGPVFTPDDAIKCINGIRKIISNSSPKFIVLSGSLPPGAKPDFIGDIVKLSNQSNIPMVVDTSGDALKSCLNAKPWLIKPNMNELSQLTGKEIRSVQDVAAQSFALNKETGVAILATCGAHGAVYTDGEIQLQAGSPIIQLVSPLGSGDSLLGAFLLKFVQVGDLRASLKYGIAAGADNATRLGSGFVDLESVEAMAGRVVVT